MIHPANADAHDRVQRPVRVLQLAGSGRSGSTLLDRMLGQHDDVFAGGEILLLWNRGLASGGRCGCGRRVVDCAIWSAVLVDVYGSVAAALDAARGNERHLEALTTRHLVDLIGWRRRRYAAQVRELTDQVEAVYRSISRLTGARIIVDASKNVVFGALMADRPGIDALTVQLIRDPRATAFSWSRPKPNPGDGEGLPMWSTGVARSSAFWSAHNLALAVFARQQPDRFMRLRYEDLVAQPARSLEALGRFAELDLDQALSRIGDGTITLRPTHSAWGNADRFAGTTVRLVADDRWRTQMRRRDVWLASAIAAPVAPLFGYPIRPPRRRGAGPD